MNYSEKLKDPRWQKKRLEVMQRDKFTCQICGEIKDTLHVHHIAYQGDNPWETNLGLLITLCMDCHEHEGDAVKDNLLELTNTIKQKGIMSNVILGLIDIVSIEKDRGWIDGYNMYSVLEFVIENDEMWGIVRENFRKTIREENKDIQVDCNGVV